MDLRSLGYFVAVVEERNFGRAAVRLHMTQPPVSRAIKQLETELGAELLRRSPTGVTLTAAGAALYEEVRTLLEQADHVRARVAAATGSTTITVGVLGDSVGEAGIRLAAAFRKRHSGVEVRIREADFTDPTTGLRAGLVDVAITRAPFDDTGISTHELGVEPMGVVLQADDPLASRTILRIEELADRQWLRLPEGTDPVWSAYWTGGGSSGTNPTGPVVRTVNECQQAILWNGTVGWSPVAHPVPEGLTCVPVADIPHSKLVVAWSTGTSNPLVQSFVHIARKTYKSAAQAGADCKVEPSA